MSETPWLPLSPRQSGALLKSLEAALPHEAQNGDGPVGPVVERLVVALVTTLRAEAPDADGASTAKDARRRARRAGFMTGAFGIVGSAPREVVELVEQARAAVDIADEVAPGRTEIELAADLLVVWGLVDDVATARDLAAETAPETLLTGLLRDHHESIRAIVPGEWTVRSSLRFVWELRALRDVLDKVNGLRGGFVQAVPVVGAIPGAWNAGRGMKRFQKDLREHLGATPAEA